jgi:hypothetical protein
MTKQGIKLPKRAPTPMVSSYKPELDVSAELDAEMANFYKSQVGVLRWIIEMGRLDITTEVSMLAVHMAAPREGHMRAVYQVFAYLKNKHNARLIYDHTYQQQICVPPLPSPPILHTHRVSSWKEREWRKLVQILELQQK